MGSYDASAAPTIPGRGQALWSYAPPRAHPIIYAGLLLFTVAWVTGSIENALRDNVPILYAVYGIPVLATLLAFLALYPSDVVVHQNGVAPARPLLLRWLRPFLPFAEMAAIYPSYYDVTGAFVSPFASSDGKVTQLGLAFEMKDGHTETVRFTPTRFVMWQPESRGYLAALDVIKQAWGERPLVAEAETFSKQRSEAMLEAAGRPFLPFFAIVLLVASAAPILWFLTRVLDVSVAWALPLSVIPMFWVMGRSYVESRRRHDLLNRLSKAAEYRRGRGDSPTEPA